MKIRAINKMLFTNNARKMAGILNAAAGVSGLEIIGLRDKETGREYRR